MTALDPMSSDAVLFAIILLVGLVSPFMIARWLIDNRSSQ